MDAIGDLLEALSNENVAGVCVSLVGLVFILAGALKLRDPQTASNAMRDFGVIRRPRAPHGSALGMAEVVLGLLLLLRIGGQATSWIAVAALSAFGLLLLRALLRGESFECACLGRWSGSLDWPSFGRTAVLAVIATIGALGESAPATEWAAWAQGVIALALLGILLCRILLVRVRRDAEAILAWRS